MYEVRSRSDGVTTASAAWVDGWDARDGQDGTGCISILVRLYRWSYLGYWRCEDGIHGNTRADARTLRLRAAQERTRAPCRPV